MSNIQLLSFCKMLFYSVKKHCGDEVKEMQEKKRSHFMCETNGEYNEQMPMIV